MSTPKWSVTKANKNIGDVELSDGRIETDCRLDGNKKATVEYRLCWEGRVCHTLTGERGKILLEEFAAELNAKGYEPAFEKGKPLLEMSEKQRTKLALMQSPPLPLD